ncbi:polysaccharide deacetylase family protein [Alkalihalobacillus sp. LMS39]|uniref:polysaccharide deacetylase family protein n=1 Tax=Alkalihalobacillus sp. LMS39 TaxID=2924032 RepID=UPI001FB49CE6|nr:polysaccharide deacetylase family protein [Alkalihalobacillus sp. LMS39]UOE92998.1 polysaccharide deacetylase family protein [Alkalihalobacillus sp. LMS39]
MKRTIVISALVFLVIGCTSEPNEVAEPEQFSSQQQVHQEKQMVTDERTEWEETMDTKEERPREETTEEEEKQKAKREPSYELSENIWITPIDDAEEEVLLLTIDDTPHQYSMEMAETLKELEVGAIFFVNGHLIQSGEGKEKVKQLHEMGFEIGNHTMSHGNLNEISAEEQRAEIKELNERIEDITGEPPRFFRAPYGKNTDISKSVVEEEGMQWMNWSYGYDYFTEYREASALENIMVNAPELTDGANLLLHDREWTNKALRNMVTGLQDKGYQFVDPQDIR